MQKLTYDDILNSDCVLYHYIRGSHAYGLQKPDGTSDIDTALVYLEPVEQLLGLRNNYQDQVADERNDNVGYSLEKFMNLLLKSNPTVLESLFIPERCIIKEHPLMSEIKKHRDKFITKACFKPFIEYGKSQIMKCRGLNKRFLQEKVERKGPMDFIYTFHPDIEGGSTHFSDWLEYRGMRQEYCGLVNIPNMPNQSVFYDWGRHFQEEGIDYETLRDAIISGFRRMETTVDIIREMKANGATENDETYAERLKTARLYNMGMFICGLYHLSVTDESFVEWFNSLRPLGYRGMVNPNGSSNELKLESIPKGEKAVAKVYYNKDGYSQHCVQYKNQKTWEKERNPERYRENCGKQFDRKNVSHAVRLLHMGIEIARGEGFNVDRTNIDRDFIMGIRMGNTSYEEIIAYIESKNAEMEEAIRLSTLPDAIDEDFVNDLLLGIRKKQIAS